jgi:hypothetical protein
MLRRVIFSILLFAAAAEAQQKPRPEGRLTAGWMGFIDESWIDHGAFGGSVRYYLTRRVAVEPELLYMIGPGADRDVMLIPHVSLDFRPGQPLRPYVIGGVGLLHHRDRFGPIEFTDNEWAWTAGLGIRIPIASRMFVAPEFRVGVEPASMITGTFGFTF